jgi:hypothetical protein
MSRASVAQLAFSPGRMKLWLLFGPGTQRLAAAVQAKDAVTPGGGANGRIQARNGLPPVVAFTKLRPLMVDSRTPTTSIPRMAIRVVSGSKLSRVPP